MPNTKLTCSQAEFFLIVSIAIESCRTYLENFHKLRPRYGEIWLNGFQERYDAVSNLPDFDARKAFGQILRVELKEQNKLVCQAFQSLKQYILGAYKEEIAKIQLKSAGIKHYRAASKHCWTATNSMLTAAVKFLNANVATLSLDLNMPPEFPNQFKAIASNFKQKHKAFIASKGSRLIKTDEQASAIRKFQTEFMRMMLDGQSIFRDDEAIKRRFVFTTVLNSIRGKSEA